MLGSLILFGRLGALVLLEEQEPPPPSEESLDFSDADNSMYLVLFSVGGM